jgi:hypothetical protein
MAPEAWDRAAETSGDVRALALIAQAHADPGLTGLAAGLQRVCRGAVDGLPLSGAIVHLADGDSMLAVAAASDPRAREVAELPFVMGVAPCLEALRSHRPVLVPDLTADGRWPGFSAAALERAVAAIFALPLQVGAVGLGVLDLYADTVGPLDQEDLGASLALARVATEMVLVGSDGSDGSGVVEELQELVERRPEIHQAQGMVMVALGVTLAEALVRMRAHAFGQGLSVIDLARGVLDGSTRPEDWDAT